MVKPLYYCLYIPVTLLAALCTDTRIRFKFVCIGDSVEVFQNITYTSFKVEITLYKTVVDKHETIALWVMQNLSKSDIIRDKYKHKVSLENGTILLHDFQESDEAAYVMLYNDSSKRKDVQLCALVPPTMRCKPNIEHQDNFLVASLNNPDHCGKPLASVRWMEYPDVKYRSKGRIELPPGNEAGTYRACIEGETLKCVKSSIEWDNCENFSTGYTRECTDNNPTVSDIPQLKATHYVIVVIISFILFLVIAILTILVWKRTGHKKPTNVQTEQRTREQRRLQDPPLQEPLLQEPPLQEVSDGESGQAAPGFVPYSQAGDIELQSVVHH